ncbi:MAG: rhomboid family intramembrane serine protease [Alcaligenaceae bacterium]|nr:MAG: rhomboid family intramembrane serine protease [Alcaligenaceae bacterium]
MLIPMKTIAFLLPERANIATMENARQGFMAANLYLQRSQRAPCFDVRVVAAQAQVRLDGGRITVNADSTLRDVGAVDICVVPPLAGDIPVAVNANAMMTEWLVGHHGSGGEVASLCLGAALPAAGQLLNDQQAVVHWAACTDYGMMFPNNIIMPLFPPIPMKAKYFVMIYAAIELFSGIGRFAGDNVAHFAHLGGAITGFILIMIWKRSGELY